MLLWLAFGSFASADELTELRSRFSELRQELAADPLRDETWGEYIQVEALAKQIERGRRADIEAVKEFLPRFSAVERNLNYGRLQRLANALATWNADGGDEELEAAQAAFADVQASLRRDRRRAPIWQEFLRLDEVESQLDAGEDRDAEAVNELVKQLESQAEYSTRQRVASVRRSLAAWVVSRETPLTAEFAKAARAAKWQYREIENWQLNVAKSRLQNELANLDAFLATGGPKKRDGWRSFLKLDDLEAILTQPDLATFRELAGIYAIHDSGEPGLQRSQFRKVHRALRHYRELLQLTISQPQRIEQARQSLKNSVTDLGSFLASLGADQEEEWQDFLRWDDLVEALESDEPSIRVLSRAASLLAGNKEGLEGYPFRRVRASLIRYAEFALSQAPAGHDRYNSQLESLARDLEEHGKSPSPSTTADIVRRLDWLENVGYTNDLTSRIAAAYSKSNLFGLLRGSLITDQIKETVTDQLPVSECIDGARVTGMANTTGYVTGQLVPSEDSVILDVTLNGTTYTNAVGRQRKVEVFISGVTTSQGVKRLEFRPESGLVAYPATATASTNQQIDGVRVNRLLGRRVIGFFAQRKANKSTPKGEQLTNRKGVDRLQQQMDERAAPMVASANKMYQEQLVANLHKYDVYPDEMNVRSSDRNVHAVARLNPDKFLSAPTAPPEAIVGTDVSVQLHESMINGVIPRYIGGLHIDSDRIEDALKSLDLPIPPDMLDKLSEAAEESSAEDSEEEEEESWSMTFDRLQPVTISFRNNRVSIAVIGRRFRRGSQSINERVRIRAEYRLKTPTSNVIKAERVGDVQIDFIDARSPRLTSQQLAYKVFITRKIGSLFGDEFTTMDIPDERVLDVMKLIDVRRIKAKKGWLDANAYLDATDLDALGISL